MSSTSTPSVLHVTTGLEIGGGEVLLLNLAEAAQRRGLNSTVVSLIADGPMRQRIRAAGIPLHTLGMRRGVPSLSGVAKLVRLIREIKPDVVQGWLYHGTIAATVALALSGRWRQTVLIHGIYGSSIDFGAYGRRVRLGFRLAAFASRFADAAVYNTEAGAEWHGAQGFRSRRVRVIENGIDPTRFEATSGLRESVRGELGLDETETVAIVIARVDPMKGWDRLLRVTERVPGLRLLAVGTGTEAFPPHPSRIPLGPREDVPSLLAAADLFILPSLFGEGTSVALTEAMAAGLPVVVTDVGDNARIAAGCGRIVAPEDEAGLEQAIGDLAADPTARAAFGAAARTRARETCSIDAMLDAYYRLYREAA
ncbi:MAG TPA: glycosyltransferase [Stellaceae bacterium]|nr:glycosyltransferase [Stellaceae bacterium]